MTHHHTLVDKFWKDKDDKQAIIHIPNLPLIGWGVFMVLGGLAKTGKLHMASDYLSFGFLFTWAWLELSSGKSYFRRVLGFVVLIVIIYNRVK